MGKYKKVQPLIRWLLPAVCLVTFLASPNLARAPLKENTLPMYGGNTLIAVSVPAYPRISILGVKTGFISDFYWEVVKYPDWNTNEAIAILLGESRGNHEAVNRNDYHKTGKCWGSFGGWQLACFRGTQEELFDIEISTKLAYELWQKEGWKPWGVYNDKSYKLYLES